jgi:alkylation response protein AidB-like acyl-CoA dehydrogenase
MDLKLNEDQAMLKKVAADFLKAEAPSHVITDWFQNKIAYIPDLYKKAADVGWLGMVIPEEFGGGGTSYTDCAVVFEEIGRGPLPGPYFTSGLLSPLLILEGGTDAQKKTLIPKICDGSSIVVPAISDDSVQWGSRAVQTRLTKAHSGFALNGRKRFVYDAEAATSFICAARNDEGEIALVRVDRNAPGISVNRREGFMIGISEVNFDNVAVATADVIGDINAGWTIIDRASMKAIPILCAYKVGACQEIFEMTNEYTRTRVVFGQPIGRFQRVQDHCVDLSIQLDGARWITYETLWKMDSNIDANASVHQAKAVASEAYYQSCNFSHMVFAGPGTDYKHPLMAHSVLAHTLYQYLGTPLYHKRAMVDALYPRQRNNAGTRS